MAYEKFTGKRSNLQAPAGAYAWHDTRDLGVSRRDFLRILTAGGTAAALGSQLVPKARAQPPPTPVLKPTPKELFYDFGSNKEMRWENMFQRGYLVPNELFFVRNHTRTPSIDVAKWRLKIEGPGVQHSLDLTYDDIVAMPSVSVIRFVECAGNGRGFFGAVQGQKAQGTQWKLGAIGVAEWTGVPLREILDRAGMKKTAVDVMPEGLDDLKVRRPMPVTKALEEDTLLVYAMNGQSLPPDHGFPARVLAPGWIGIANVKWVGRIEVSEKPLFSAWNTDSYIMVGPDYKPNPPAKGPILSSQNIKSALELAWDGEVATGRRLVRGRSWSPSGGIAKIEYSFDQGKSWDVARLRAPNTRAAWTRWDFDWEAKPGKHIIRVRATDEKGNTQPDRVPFNEQGYLYNAIVDHPLRVS